MLGIFTSMGKGVLSMGGLGMDGPGKGGRHSFNFFLTFTVLFSFVMSAPAQAAVCDAVPTCCHQWEHRDLDLCVNTMRQAVG